jgi:phosphoribosylamine--glycine ligase
MLTKDGPKVLEFNCRFGDPEAQVILSLLESDLVELMLASLEEGGLSRIPPPQFMKDMFAVCVVLAADGYPSKAVTGAAIDGIPFAQKYCNIYHAGTKRTENGFEVAGGRVLNTVGLHRSLDAATRSVYDLAQKISWPGMQMRTDIGL